MNRICLPCVALVALAAGCGKSEPPAQAAAVVKVRSPGTPLTAEDMRLFLTVVRSHEGSMIPEFTPPDDDADAVDHTAPARELAAAFRDQFRRLFNDRRQGAVWERDRRWARALAGRNVSPVEFAGLVRHVSCAIMRVRLEARVDIDDLVAQARRQYDDALRRMIETEGVPAGERSRSSTFSRTQSVIRLGRAVALLEFAEMVRQVPEESCEVVRRFSKEIKPLLPAGSHEELLGELEKLVNDSDGEVQQAVYETTR